ncbi:MAG: hypothetical protein HC860_15105 [Alkalinema sp. RU_4_3]|nr:hypothetical protein [Alkalinema sp. RU_4_3]
MNLPIPKTTVDFHFLVEESSEGQVVATVAELADCQVIAKTQADAIVELEKKLHDRFTKITVVPFTMSVNAAVEPQDENPWTEFMGMYKDDPIFAEIAAELRVERGLEHLGWVE